MKGTNIGEFEELVLLAVASEGEDAYAVSIKESIESNAGRSAAISAVHSALYRLEQKGFLRSKLGGATQKRGGKEKRLFQVTNSGLATLKESKELREGYWRKIPQLSLRKS
jgi:PadR family transcriptional regulator, regulatory protein PadR